MNTDVEIIEAEPTMRLGILPARTPHDVIVQATSIAKELAVIVKQNHLSKQIQGREYVYVDGWSTMGAMLGVLPREVPELTRRFDDGSYEATVELIRINDGAIIGRASAFVGMDEKDRSGHLTWGSRPEYARRSMAVTRATGKAFRLGFSWIMGLAGYAPTPAEEMEGIENEQPTKRSQPPAQPPVSEPLEPENKMPNPEEVASAVQPNKPANFAPANAAPPVKRLIECGVVEGAPAAVAILKRLNLIGEKDLDKVERLGKIYRGWRDVGKGPDEAYQLTLEGKIPQ